MGAIVIKTGAERDLVSNSSIKEFGYFSASTDVGVLTVWLPGARG